MQRIIKHKKFIGHKKKGLTVYIPILVILLSLTIITASTFAFFADRNTDTGNITFNKVALSEGTYYGITRTLNDALPGTAIINDTLSFAKAVESANIFVRAKLSFSYDGDDTQVESFLDGLRSTTASSMNISGDAIGTTGAKWSEKIDNYVYLINESDPQAFFNVTDSTEYILTSEITVPTSLTQGDDYSQYMEQIDFNFAFQAIQSANMGTDFATIVSTFDEVFPLATSEVIPYGVSATNAENAGLTYLRSGVEFDPETDPIVYGDIISITATPTEGYTLDSITVNGQPYVLGTQFVATGDISVVTVVSGTQLPTHDLHIIRLEYGATLIITAVKDADNNTINIPISFQTSVLSPDVGPDGAYVTEDCFIEGYCYYFEIVAMDGYMIQPETSVGGGTVVSYGNGFSLTCLCISGFDVSIVVTEDTPAEPEEPPM